jgi:hypothetical protein
MDRPDGYSLEKRAEQLATEFARQARTAEYFNGLMRLMLGEPADTPAQPPQR